MKQLVFLISLFCFFGSGNEVVKSEVEFDRVSWFVYSDHLSLKHHTYRKRVAYSFHSAGSLIGMKLSELNNMLGEGERCEMTSQLACNLYYKVAISEQEQTVLNVYLDDNSQVYRTEIGHLGTFAN